MDALVVCHWDPKHPLLSFDDVAWCIACHGPPRRRRSPQAQRRRLSRCLGSLAVHQSTASTLPTVPLLFLAGVLSNTMTGATHAFRIKSSIPTGDESCRRRERKARRGEATYQASKRRIVGAVELELAGDPGRRMREWRDARSATRACQ